jgi:CHAT domain-containing protein/tetratricopeptide (TPR) repeat protein
MFGRALRRLFQRGKAGRESRSTDASDLPPAGMGDLRREVSLHEVRELVARAMKLWQADRTEEAVAAAERAHAIAVRDLRPDDREYVLAFARYASMLRGERDEVVRLLEHVLPMAERALGAADADYAAILNNLAMTYYNTGRPEPAVPLMERAIQAKRLCYGDGDAEYLPNLQDLILVLEDLGRVAETEPHVREIAGIVRRVVGEASGEYVIAAQNLARVCRVVGKEAEAAELEGTISRLTGVAANAKDAGPVDSPARAALVGEARRAYEADDFALAVRLHRELLAGVSGLALPLLLGEVLGNVFDPLLPYADELRNEAVAADEGGDHSRAAVLFRRCVEVLRVSFGPGHVHVALALNSLGLALSNAGEFEEAKKAYSGALGRLGSPEQPFPELERVRANVARLYTAICDRGAPDPSTGLGTSVASMAGKGGDYARSLRIRFPVPIEGEPPVVNASRWFDARAKFYESQGDHARAGFLYEMAVEMLNLVYPGDVARLTTPSLELAGSFMRRGKLRDADGVLGRLSEQFDSGEQPPPVESAEVWRQRGRLLAGLADYAEAEAAMLRAREIVGAHLGTNHPSLAEFDDDLIVVRVKLGKREEARESMRAVVSRFDDKAETRASTEEAERVAAFLLELGEVGRAEGLYRRVLERQRAEVGEWDPRYAQTLVNFGTLCRAAGRWSEAEGCFRQAVKIRRAEFGPDHTLVAGAEARLALTIAATPGAARWGEALAAVEEAFRISSLLVGEVGAIGAERQLFQLLREQRGNLNLALTLGAAALATDPTAAQRVYQMVLRRKALGVEALAARRLAVLGGRYPHLRERLGELDRLTVLIVQARSGAGKDGGGARELTAARERREQLESELSRLIPEVGMGRLLNETTVAQVAGAVPDDGVLIEYVRFEPLRLDRVAPGESDLLPPRYLAFVLRGRDAAGLRMLDLGAAEPIEELLAAAGEGLAGDAADLTRSAGGPELTALRAAVLEPLRGLLGGRTRLLVAPDGLLATLPLDVLPLGDGRFVIDAYHVSYLGSGRDVLGAAGRTGGQRSAGAVIAGPDFDLRAALPGRASGVDGESEAKHDAQSARVARSLKELGTVFSPLPGTEDEGRLVAACLRDSRELIGAAALKSVVRGLASPVVLHFATHGFYLPPDRSGPAGSAWQEAEAAMAGSGLALAGANTWLRGGAVFEGAEDGILTAEDVATLDLTATDLVVLSACESGIGAAVPGDGIFGLRRAFVAAGARTVVMSLWKVPDAETKDLMRLFYERLAAGRSKGDALREAKLEVRKAHPHPFFWGSFVCQGDAGAAPPEAFVGAGVGRRQSGDRR